MSARDFAELTHSAHGKPLQWWHYGDSFAVAAFIDRNGRRIALPAVRNGTSCYWHEPSGSMPLYGTAALRARPDAPVLVVETERAADAAGGLFPDHVCVTWAGGSNAVLRADIAPLSGRDVVLWPDRDGAGLTAMTRLQARLRGRARSVARIDVPDSWPASWDLAKPLPFGVSAETLRRMLRDAAVAPLPVGTGAPEDPIPCQTKRPAEAAPIAAPPGGAAPMPDDAGACFAQGESCPGSAGILPAHGLPFEAREGRPHPSTSLGAGAGAPGSLPSLQSSETGAESEHEPDANGTWPDPDWSLLDNSRGDLPEFPLDALPPFWRAWSEGAARGASAPVDHVALALLTAAAGLIGVARRVAPAPSWSEPCILWTALVGPPSSGKTPAMDASLRLVRALERGRAAMNSEVRRPPSRPRPLAIDDADIEAIARVLTAAPRGVLLSCDDRSLWLDDLAGAVRRGANRAFWPAAWTGGACGVHRKPRPGVGPIVVRFESAAVSILGTIRPEAIAPALAGGDDGTGARFLFAWPPRAAFHALPDMQEAGSAAALDALARLRDMPDAPRDLPLAPDAESSFDRFRRAHYAESGGLEDREAEWWGKGTGTVLRLAGVLSFLDWAAGPGMAAEPAHVPAWAVRAAAALWQDYLWPHARAIFRVGGGSEAQLRVRRAVRWLATQRLPEVSREQLRRAALRQAVNAAGTDDVIDVLVEGGWLRPLEPESGRRGPKRRRWLVNPALWEKRHA